MTEQSHKDSGISDAQLEGIERVNFFTILRNRNFRYLWIGQIVSQVGDYFAFLAIMVVVAGFSQNVGDTTREVSGVMIAAALPRLLFGVLAGVFVDRWDRRLTMLASDLVRPALTLAMIPAFLTQNLWLIYGLTFVMSAVGSFFNPAKGALIPNMVPTEHLTAANALSQTSMTMAFVLGPALAGAAFAALGSGNEWLAFVFDAASYLVSALAIWSIRLPKTATMPGIATGPEQAHSRLHLANDEDGPLLATQPSPLRRVWEELTVGLKALFLNRAMATLAVVFAVTMLGVGALNVLWVSFLKSGFGYTESSELGWRFAVVDIAFFIGMVTAGVAAGNFLSKLPPKQFIVWGLIGAGVVTLPLGYLPDYWLVVASMFLVGLTVAPINTGVMTLMQIVVPNSQLGRVGGGIGTISEAASLGSMSLAGFLAASLGIPLVFFIAGVMCIAGGVLALVGLPNLTLDDMIEREIAPAPMPLDTQTRQVA